MTTAAPERVRFTIAVEQDVYEAFAELAHTSGVSLSRCIGDWLRDTAEAAQMTTLKLHDVRRAPQSAFERYVELQGDATRAQAEAMPEFIEHLKRTSWRAPSPPSSNTGGKVPRENHKKGGAR